MTTYYRPKLRGDLVNQLKNGKICEVVSDNVEITKILISGWLNFEDFTIKKSENDGWSLFVPVHIYSKKQK